MPPWRPRHENPIVFLDVIIGDAHAGRLLIELRADIVPQTAEHFRQLCTGELTDPLTGRRRQYAHCDFHRVVLDKFCQAGDYVNHDLLSGLPDVCFPDENFILRHTGAGVLSMVNAGPDTNASPFYLHFAANPELDGRHVVFGALADTESLNVLDQMHRVATSRGDPKQRVRIACAGQLGLQSPAES